MLLLFLQASNVNASVYHHTYSSQSNALSACNVKRAQLDQGFYIHAKACDWKNGYYQVRFSNSAAGAPSGDQYDANKYIFIDPSHSDGLYMTQAAAKSACESYSSLEPYVCVAQSSNANDWYTHHYSGANSAYTCMHTYLWKANTAPSINITTPSKMSIKRGEQLQLTATVTDIHDNNLESSIKWYDGNSQKTTGKTYNFSSNTIGLHTIKAKITDKGGLTSEATITIDVTGLLTISILSPYESGEKFYVGDSIHLEGVAINEVDNDKDISTNIQWIDTTTNTLLGQGATFTLTSTKVGAYYLTARITDPASGNISSDNITVNFLDDRKEVIIYLNGMLTNKPAAELNYAALLERFSDYKNASTREVLFDNVYSHSHGVNAAGAYLDIREVLQQKMSDTINTSGMSENEVYRELRLAWGRHANGYKYEPNDSIAASATEFITSVVLDLESSYLVSGPSKELYEKIINYVDAEYTVLVIAHSQGNFYVNGAISGLGSSYTDSVGVMHLANPSANYARVTYAHHFTSELDEVIGNIRVLFDTLPPNIKNTDQYNSNLIQIYAANSAPLQYHGFNDTYLSDVIGSEVLQESVSILNRLEVKK